MNSVSDIAARPPGSFADLSGHRALVTGASSGIGKAIACELARGGADLVIHCRESHKVAEVTAAQCRGFGRQAHVISCDLSRHEELPGFADRAWGALGDLSLCINNAGADVLTRGSGRLDFSRKLESLLDVDVTATVILSREIGRRMKSAGTGSIINIGWDQAAHGMEGDSGELFAATKNAIMGFTRSLALSLAPEVRVNCIAPGWIRTAWGEQAGPAWQERVRRETPLARWGTPEDIAALARFLCSTEAAYITGQVINANGGAVR